MSKKVIDIHTHAFTNEMEKDLIEGGGLLGKNIEELGKVYNPHSGLSITETGLISQLETSDYDGIKSAVLLALDEKSLKYPTERTFELAQEYPSIIPSIAVHPENDNTYSKLEDGILRWYYDFEGAWFRPVIAYDIICDPRKVDPKYWDVVNEAEATVVAHTGPVNSAEGVASERNSETDPRLWESVIKKYGDSRKFNLVLSHCGTPSKKFSSYESEALEVATNKNVWVDHAGLLYIDDINGEDYHVISKPAFSKTVDMIKKGILLPSSVVGGTDYPVITDIDESKNEQIVMFRGYGAESGFNPFRNTYKALKA